MILITRKRSAYATASAKRVARREAFARQYGFQFVCHAKGHSAGVKNKKFSPPDLPAPPHQPKNRKHPSDEEEKRLRALAPEVSSYLDFLLKIKGLQGHAFLRRLLALSQKIPAPLFIQSVRRASQYRISSLETVERIAVLYFKEATAELPLAEIDEGFREREAYLEGSLTDQPDLSIYQDPPQPNHE